MSEQTTRDRLYKLLDSNAIHDLDDETGIATINVDAFLDDVIQATDAELTSLRASQAALVEALKTIVVWHQDAKPARNDYDSGYNQALDHCANIAESALAAQSLTAQKQEQEKA